MSDEYIRREDAITEICDCTCGELKDVCKSQEGCSYYEALKLLPSADVAPVRHGRWLPIVSYNNTYKCSECGRLLVDITDGLKMVAKHYPYCHCGAKMDAQGEE